MWKLLPHQIQVYTALSGAVFIWNDDIGNYCLAEKNGRKWEFKMPLEPLMLSSVGGGFSDTLQMIYYRKTGRINDRIGRNKKDDIELAKKMGCY